MNISLLQKILKGFAEKPTPEQVKILLGVDINEDTLESVFELGELYGTDLQKWPRHFIAILAGNELLDNIASTEIPVFDTDHTNFVPVFEESKEPELKATKSAPKRRSVESLTEEEQQQIKEIHASNMPYIDKFKWMFDNFGVQQRTANSWFSILGLTQKKATPDVLKGTDSRELTKKIHLITCAQNATPIHKVMWENMKLYADHLDAEIHVIPTRYKNPTSVFTDSKEDWWVEELHPYLDTTNHNVCKDLVILGGFKVQPTAAYPLKELNAITTGRSAIVGHPKMHLESVPVLEGENKQKLWSTGSLTVENYTDSRAGAKGKSHHTFGFIIVEMDGDDFHIRHVPVCEDGTFQDLWFKVDGSVTICDKIRTLVLGDAHFGDHSDDKIDASITLAHQLVPEHVVLHDNFNGHSVNHHEAKDGVKAFHRINNKRHLLSTEIEEMFAMLHWMTQELGSSKFVVVRSNHDAFLDRYLVDRNWKDDAANADWYAECLLVLLRDENCKGVIPYLIEKEFGDRIICLGRDDSYRPGEYQLANHGDLGTNGSKGSPLQYSKLNTKQITAHTHTPTRINGLLVAGTSTKLRVGYNVGPSSWSHADVIEYLNGKGTHIIYNDKFKFTTLEYPL